MIKRKKKDISLLIGKKFGRLTILEDRGSDKSRQKIVLAKCDCDGNTKEYNLCLILNNITKSCGCYRSELRTKENTTHNLSKHPLYRIYHGMLKRCYNTKCKNYRNYGGRGVYVALNWLGKSGFINFYNDMNTTFKKGSSLDRIDNNGPYSKKNCRWADRKQQNRNSRRNHLITYNEKTKCISEWAEIYQIPFSTLRSRLNVLKWPIEKALLTLIKEIEKRSYPKTLHPRLITFNNITKRLSEWAKFLQISHSVLHGRINRGWSIEKAFTTPVRKTTRQKSV